MALATGISTPATGLFVSKYPHMKHKNKAYVHKNGNDKMERQEDHVADRPSQTFVTLVKVRLVGTVMPPAGSHECLERDFAISCVSEYLGNLPCQLFPFALWKVGVP